VIKRFEFGLKLSPTPKINYRKLRGSKGKPDDYVLIHNFKKKMKVVTFGMAGKYSGIVIKNGRGKQI